MKANFFLIAFLVLFVTEISVAQEKKTKFSKSLVPNKINLFPDSIRVELPNEKAFVVFELKRYTSDHSYIDNFSTMLSELVKFIKQSSADSDFTTTPHHAKVILKEYDEKEVTVESTRATSTKLIIRKNQLTQLLPPGWEITILGKDCRIYVYGKDLESLEKVTNVNFKIVTDKVNILPNTLGRKSIKGYMVLKDGSIETNKVEIKRPTDLVLSEPSFGFGFVSNAFYPYFKLLSTTFAFRDRFGRMNQRLKFDIDFMLLTKTRLDGNLTVNPIEGLSMSYGWNLSKNTGGIRWLDLGVGAIDTQHDQTYFRGTTIRFYLSFDLGNNFSLVPELYLTDNSNNGLAGLKLNYKFP